MAVDFTKSDKRYFISKDTQHLIEEIMFSKTISTNLFHCKLFSYIEKRQF